MGKFDPKQYIGMRVLANCGQYMTCTAYRKANDIDVQFEDGTIVRGVEMGAFKKGQVKNPNCLGTYCAKKAKEHIGEKALSDNGQWMEIVAYINSKHITVRFEDGTLVETTYSDFKRGCVGNPNYTQFDKKQDQRNAEFIGKSAVMNNGMLLTVDAYDHYDPVRKNHYYHGTFEDGAGCVFEISRFTAGVVGHPEIRAQFNRSKNARVGMIFKTKQGLTGKVLEYDGCHKVKFQLETGKIGYARFNKLDQVMDFDFEKQKQCGQKYDTIWGISATIVDYSDKDHLKAQFDDGFVVNATRRKLQDGMWHHPVLIRNRQKSFVYLGFQCLFACKTSTDCYYECKCGKCGHEDILSVKEMLLHKCA